MTVSRKWFLALGLVSVAVAFGMWRMHAQSVHSPVAVSGVALLPELRPVAQSTGASAQIVQPKFAVDPVEARKKATDYLQLVNLLLPMAKEGSAVAQYEVARALHYCDQNWRRASFFSPKTGALRTADEMLQLYAKLPENTQILLKDADRRCHSFSEDVSILGTANHWLEEAATAAYAPAVFMKADIAMKSHLMDGDTAAIQQAREQAISASTSANPEVLAGMVDFVQGGNRPSGEVAQLMSAWWLLACNSGYDCGANSELARGMCTVDPQCSNQVGVVADLERMNGAHFGEVQLLAEQISAAISSGNSELIQKYL